MNKQKKKTVFFFLLITLLALPLVFPFFRSGYFSTHDGEWAVIRLSAFHFALKDGQIPPRWAGNLFYTYGYPVLNFNYPLPPILGEFFHLLGFGFVDSVKLVFVASIVFSAFFVYLLISLIFNSLTGVFAAIVYLYYPFKMVDLFVRGSIGESLAFAILPAVYWSLIKLEKNRAKNWIVFASIFLAFFILSHNSIAFISFPFIFLFMIFNLLKEKKENRLPLLRCYALVLLHALALSCFFWLPALWEKKYTILQPGIITDPLKHFPSFRQLILPNWGYGRSQESNSLSFQIGALHLCLFLLSLLLVLRKTLKDKIREKERIVWFFVSVFLLNFFLLLPISSFVWKILPLMVYLSYPWRILTPLGLYLTIITSYFFFQVKKRSLKLALLGVIFLVFLITTKDYRQPLEYVNRGEGFYITNQSTTIQGDENTPVWVKTPPQNAPEEKIELEKGKYQIVKQKSNYLRFLAQTPERTKVAINTIYYPGWQVFVNSKRVGLGYQDDPLGRLVFEVPQGSSEVVAVFKETPIRLVADIISLTSLVLVGGLLIKRKRVK